MQFIKFDAIDSTSDYLRQLMAKESVGDGTVIWALEQTQGRGQPGKTWSVEGGKNLTFSILKRYERFPAKDQFLVNIWVSLAIKQVLDFYGIADLAIKWPNDIMAGRKKICGILIENQLRGNQIVHSIIGIGLNVNQTVFPGLPNATSVVNEIGRLIDLEFLLKEICKTISEAIPDEILLPVAYQREAYEKQLFGYQEKMEFEDRDGNRFRAVNLGIDPQGLLVLEKEDGSRSAYDFQSVRFIL